MTDRKIIMVGPEVGGLGGISRVVKSWEEGGFATKYNVVYIPSTPDEKRNKYRFLVSSLLRFIRQIDRSVSGVYVHTASRNSFYRKSVFILLSKLLGKKVVVHIHPSFFTQFLSQMKGVRRTVFFRLLKAANGMVVLTPGIARDIKALFPDQDISILCNPINIKKMVNRNNIQRLESRILYLGRYTKEKGIYDLVDAMEILRNQAEWVELEMYGTDEVDQLRRYVSNKGLAERITVNGWIDEWGKIDALYRNAMLVLPSYTEGIPNVILEAMATRTPIVSTRVGGLVDILTDRENAIIAQPGNSKDLAEKISLCLKDRSLRERIVENSYMAAKERYDLPVNIRELGDVLSKFGMA